MGRERQDNLRWHHTYQSILKVLFVLRILGIIGSVLSFFTSIHQAKYDYPGFKVPGWLIIWLLVIIILGILLLVYNMRVIKGLKSPSSYTYTDLKAYYVIIIIWSFLSRVPNGFLSGLIAAVVVTSIIIPCFIYYYNRRYLFGVTFFCVSCKKEKKLSELHSWFDNDDERICNNCYYQSHKTANTENTKVESESKTEKKLPKSSTGKKDVLPVTKTKDTKPPNKNSQKPVVNDDKNVPAKVKQSVSNQKNINLNQVNFCRKCGLKLDNDSVFCKRCGTKIISSVCKKCGNKLDEDSVFCKKCGTKVDD